MRSSTSVARPWLATAAIALALGGCSGGNDLQIVPVRGKITFAGGPCPAAGTVTFSPQEVAAGLPRRPASATFHADGLFVATSFKPGDGLIPGRYKVSIACDSGLPDPRSPDPWGDVSFIAKGYEPPELVVEAGSEPMEVNFDVTPKKPAI